MRHSEIMRLRWDEINFPQRRIFIGKAKAGQREQPIPETSPPAWRRNGSNLANRRVICFLQVAKHPHRSTMTKQFRRSVKRAGLRPDKVTPHILRHTAITALVKSGVDLPTIQKISGHKTLAMILRYTQLSDAHVDRSVAKLNVPFPDTITPELHTQPNKAVNAAA